MAIYLRWERFAICSDCQLAHFDETRGENHASIIAGKPFFADFPS
ncbi:MAG: hypothetical protein QM684_01370 [Rhizobium sp.]